MKNKIIAGMSDADYHSTPDLSASGIKLIDSKTPLHFWDAYINPDREPRAESAVFEFGKAWHCAMFEPGRFAAMGRWTSCSGRLNGAKGGVCRHHLF